MAITTTPAKGLPERVRALFDAKQRQYNEYLDPTISKLSHRGEAFYRLFSSADPGMLAIWNRVPDYEEFSNSKPGRFVDCLILATDAVMSSDLPESQTDSLLNALPRLREKHERLARKLGILLAELQLVTPRQTLDGKPIADDSWFGEERERLAQEFGVDIPHIDLGELHQRLKISAGVDSKQGYTQHRRASDHIRQRVIETAIALIDTGHAAWLHALITRLKSWPDFAAEKMIQPLLISQKPGWGDWLAQANLMLSESYEIQFMRLIDWQILIGLLFEEWPDLQKISEILIRSKRGRNSE